MILDFLFPNRCLNCNQIIDYEEIVCKSCEDQLHFTHWKMAEENPLLKRCQLLFPIENATALLQFEKDSLSQKVLHELKYGSKEWVGKTIANWTVAQIDFPENIDLLVSVPLHPKKLKKRGYNQLHLYTKTLSEKLNIPYSNNLLQRNSYQKAQAKKDKFRRSETKYDFTLTEKLEGKHVLLIDDVFTTGSTLSAIAWEILKEPNNRISILVMAMDF